jgi:hypothetical protein
VPQIQVIFVCELDYFVVSSWIDISRLHVIVNESVSRTVHIYFSFY